MPREVKSKKSKASGLGKGLGNLMKVDSVESVLPEKEIHELPISELVPNADQPRKSFDEDSLATLAESIKNLGIFQPIVVRKQKNKYQIVAGERRYRAAIIAGLEIVPVIVKKYNTEEMTEVALVENLQREGLDPIEEALAYQGLMDTYKQTQEMISARLGRSRSYIANMVRLLKLCDSVQKDLIEGDLTVGQARPLLALRSAAQQIEAAEIDGASKFQIFKSITFPQILLIMAPSLIQQFIGNINNFNVIYFLTGGGPTNSEYYQAGSTDLLVTWLYKLTVSAKDYNLASVIGILIFAISATFSLLAYTRSSSFKEGAAK